MPASITNYVNTDELGANWRLMLFDADGNPLTMHSFEAIDFGAISYKEIFQNVKTILATPLFSAVLERTLGIDANIVDLPVDRAAELTVAIMDALYYWENRVKVMDIHFATDLNGHLAVSLQLQVRNIIYGTDQSYLKTTIREAEPIEPPELPPMVEPPPEGVIVVEGPPGPPGPQGPAGATGPKGQRGSAWFTGTVDPTAVAGAQAQDMYLNTTTAAIFQYDGTAWRIVFNGVDKQG